MTWATKVVRQYSVTEVDASGELDLHDLGTFGFSTLRIGCEATLVQGTNPTLDVTIEDTVDDINWNTVGTFTQFTDVGVKIINIHPGNTGAGFSPLIGPRLRCKYVITGSDGVEPDPELLLSFKLSVWGR